MAAIEISDKAATRIRALLEEKKTPAGGLRLGVKGGGCSGLSYFLDWAAEPSKFDQVVERDGARVFVDPKSAVFLQGTVIDWQQTLMQS
ncbi:MAG TPA: iron-sulfur cluster assembly accessory protein, partial [Anaeromyxobacter sp.]|nr:iron-sulfur cluster assembly accessory protein [Anaeromyxobacter sp.]